MLQPYTSIGCRRAFAGWRYLISLHCVKACEVLIAQVHATLTSVLEQKGLSPKVQVCVRVRPSGILCLVFCSHMHNVDVNRVQRQWRKCLPS